MLEHHAGHLTTEFLQVGSVEGLDINPVDHDLAVGGVEQLVDRADGGGLTGARQAHDHENLAPLDVEVDVAEADDVPGSSVHLSFAHAALAELEGSATRLGSEDLVHVFDPDELFAHLDHVNSPWVAQRPVWCASAPLPQAALHLRSVGGALQVFELGERKLLAHGQDSSRGSGRRW